MTTSTADVQNTENPFTMSKSGGSLQDSLMDFFIDIDTDVLSSDGLDALTVLYDDLEWLHSRGLNEIHFAKKSSSGARTTARKWYKQNRGRVSKLQMKLKKSKAAQKKKEIMAKSSQTPVTIKKKKKYNTAGHTINEKKLRAGVKASVAELFEKVKYRVIREFTIAEGVDAAVWDQIQYKFGIWTLIKKDGQKILFKIDESEISDFIKIEDKVTVEDLL